jgi:hypothetical protein
MRTTILCFALTLLAVGCSRQPGGAVVAETPRFHIAPSDISSTATTLDTGWTENPTQRIAVLHIGLSESKATEFREFTKRHVNQRVEYMVAGKSLCQPKIRREIISGQIEVPLIFASEEVVSSLSKK